MKRLTRIVAILLLVFSICSAFTGCDKIISGILGGDGNNEQDQEITLTQLNIVGVERLTLKVGDIVYLSTDAPNELAAKIEWSASNECVTVSGGTVRAIEAGACVVFARYGKLYDKVLVEIKDDSIDGGNDGEDGGNSGNGNIGGGGNIGGTDTDIDPSVDPYAGISKSDFYADYTPSVGYWDSYYRSIHGLMSGTIGAQDQAPTISEYQPTYDGMLVRNSVGLYGSDGNSYTIVDAYGTPVMTIYRGGAYIMLEEVAAYLFAFGDIPANHTPAKSTSKARDMFTKWGEYLRLNHTNFSGSTTKYPYEPELPNISGCGGDLQYYEVDVGTTGTDCDPSYPSVVYNNGSRIERGAARIVYTYKDKNGDKIIDINEKYLFYTYNHYNDFREYLNYYGGWGEMFGNVTGGGTLSSKYNYNPTPYVRTVKMDITRVTAFVIFDGYFLVVDNKVYA